MARGEREWANAPFCPENVRVWHCRNYSGGVWTTRTKTVVRTQAGDAGTDEQVRAECEQLSCSQRHSGQRTSRRDFPKSCCGNPLGDISASEDPLAACGGEGSVATLTATPGPDGQGRERMGQRTVLLENVRVWHCRRQPSHHRVQTLMPIYQ